MRKDEASQVAANMHRLANKIEELAEQSETLSEENVNTATARTLINKQSTVQKDLRQLISDLIQMHAESGSIKTDEKEFTLGKNGFVPIPSDSDTQLPPPRVGPPGRGKRGPPPWSNAGGNKNGNGKSGNPGNGNSGNPGNGNSGNPGRGS